MYVRKLYPFFSAVLRTVPVLATALVLLSFYHSPDCPPHPSACAAGQFEADELPFETVSKDSDDRESHPRVFIRTRGTLKSFMRCLYTPVTAAPSAQPAPKGTNQQYYGTIVATPAYYTFLFRYTPF